MEQSVYTKISKAIGWEGGPIALPTLAEAEMLYEEIRDHQSIEAFTKVFRFIRFAKTAENVDEVVVSNIIHAAYMTGQQYFK